MLKPHFVSRFMLHLVSSSLMSAPGYLQRLVIEKGSEILTQGEGFGNLENDTEILADKRMGEYFLERPLAKNPDMIGKIVIEGMGEYKIGEGLYTAYVDPLDGSLQYHLRKTTRGMAYSAIVTIVFEPSQRTACFSDIVAAGIVDLRFTNPPDIWLAGLGEGSYLRDVKFLLSDTPSKVDLSGEQLVIAEMYYSKTRSAVAQAFSGTNGYIRSQGSAALEMAYVSNGIAQAFFCGSQKLHELGAAYLLIREAGGYIATFDRNFIMSPLDNLSYVFNSKIPVILACNESYALDLLSKFQQAFPDGIEL